MLATSFLSAKGAALISLSRPFNSMPALPVSAALTTVDPISPASAVPAPSFSPV
ncbi:hypothetical protein Tco_0512882, partial [Tanacetum coccineum]